MFDRTLKTFIREEVKRLREEWWAEAYDKLLIDDESFNKKSVFVPDDIKTSIKKWMFKMRLSKR